MNGKRGLLIVLCLALLATSFPPGAVAAEGRTAGNKLPQAYPTAPSKSASIPSTSIPIPVPDTVSVSVPPPRPARRKPSNDGPTEAEVEAMNEQLRRAAPAEAAEILADYARANGLDTARVPAPPPARHGQPRDLSLRLGGRSFVPAPGLEPTVFDAAQALTDPQLSAAGYEAALARFPTRHIPCVVQFSRELSMDERIELYGLGLKLEQPVADYAVLSPVPAESVAALADLDYVRWVGEYRPAFKREPGEDWTNGAWIFPIGADRPEYDESLGALGLDARYDAAMGAYLASQINPLVEDVAALWWVRRIEPVAAVVNLDAPEPDVDFSAGDSREMIGAPYVWPSYTGADVTVGVFDGGLWAGNTADFPPGAIHASSDTTPDEKAHGTHVSGIIAARGGYDIEGPHDAKGVAPGAAIFMRDHNDSSAGLGSAFTAWESAGAKVSNHSWGVKGSNQYTYDSSVTELVDGRADEHDDIVIVSAGNDWDPQKITNPGTAKNVTTVGAINYATGSATDQVGYRARYSSRGPTKDDGRLKPDVVAPGGTGSGATGNYFKLGVVSTNAQIGSSWVITGSHDQNDYWQPITYTRKSGTSQAAPHVAGAAALMLQSDSDMTSELFKAWLIATSIPLHESGSNPRNGYASIAVGYGLVNAYNASGRSYGGESDYALIMEGTVTEDSDEQDSSVFYVPASTERLAVALAYDDEKGCGSWGAPGCLVDDLDLRLTAPDATEYTYILPISVTNESPLEKIIVEDPPSGWWDVEVLFADYASWPGTTSSQDYAVVAYAIHKTPALAFADPYFSGAATPTFHVQPGSAVYTPTLAPAVENSGGWIAAGVTAGISDVGGPGGSGFQDVTNTIVGRFVGNLMWQGHTQAVTYTGVMTAPSTQGTYTMMLEAAAVNREIQPISKTFQIVVDDDFDPPAFVGYADSGDAPAGPYTFTVTLADPNGITDTATLPKICYRWGSGDVDADNNDGCADASVSGSGPTYTGAATLTVSADHEGQTLYWRPYACDGDDTVECAWGDVQLGGTIQPGAATAPDAPADLAATPGSWTNVNFFSINWTDPGSIAGAYYRRGSPPTYDTDGTYTTDKPFSVAATAQGGQTLYVWLKGTDGGVDYGNRSSVTLYYDGAAPTAPTSATGWDSSSKNTTFADDTWQSDDDDLYFEWSGASDTGGSGLSGYSVYWGTSSSGEPGTTQEQTSASYDPVAFSGTYYLRVRAFDAAGNYSAAVTLFTARYEGTAPSNPSAATGWDSAGKTTSYASDTWQNSDDDLYFEWSGASDSGGSGLSGYSVYWGTSSSGEPGTTQEQSSASYDPGAFSSVRYLRVRTFDAAGNYSAPTTLYVAKYDGQGPTGGTIAINSGAGSTDSLIVTLNGLSAIDGQSGMGSGAQMRFSNDDAAWSAWEAYGSSKSNWDLSAYGGDTSGGTKRVYVQYRDALHNESASFSDEIVYVVPPPTQETDGLLLINEIDPGAYDAVEIYNPFTGTVDMTGWQLVAKLPGGPTTNYTFPSFSLSPGAYVVMHETSGTNTATDLYMGQNIYWDSSGNGSCALLDDLGDGVDFVRWGNSTEPPPSPTGWTGTNPQFAQPDDTTLGRDDSSTDTDDGSDWSEQSATLGLVNAPTAPTAEFAANPRSGYPPLTVSFSDASTGQVDSYSWDFGDGYGSAAQNPTHIYDMSGVYTVTLATTGPGGADSETKTSYIEVWDLQSGQEVFGLGLNSHSPSNDYAGNVFSVVTPTVLTGIKYRMSFSNPGTLYFFVYEGNSENGTYSRVFKSSTFDVPAASGWFSLSGMQLTLRPGKYYFIGVSWTELAFLWFGGSEGPASFGALEGSADFAQYFPASSVTVSTGPVPYYMPLVTEPLPVPQAEFLAAPTSGQKPLQVQFVNFSSGYVDSYLWDFGDGETSTGANPSHTYDTAGTYTVVLTATNSSGSDVRTRSAYIHVYNPPPVADFTADTTLGGASLTVQFTDQSSGTVTSRDWDFGDGGTSTATNPSHTYTAAGVYTVTLSIDGPDGSDTEVKPRYVQVLAANEDLLSGIMSPFVAQRGAGSMVYVTSTTQLREISMYLGVYEAIDLRFYVYENYNMCGNSNDWAKIHENTISVGGARTGWFSSGPITVTLQSGYGYFIGVSYPDSVYVRIPMVSGQQNPRQLSFGWWGGENGDIVGYPLIDPLPWEDICNYENIGDSTHFVAFATGGLPGEIQADFTATPRSGQSPLTVQFEDLSSGTVAGYLWGFGDGDTSTESDPEHEYVAGGPYTVTLAVEGPFDSDAVTKTAYIDVETAPESVPFFDDFESGVGRWRTAGYYSGLWHLNDETSAYVQTHSPTHSWWYGSESTGTYEWYGSNYGSLTSPPIDLSADLDGAVLIFWNWFETESSTYYDRRLVQISTNGSSFSTLQQLDNYHNRQTWHKHIIDLSSYIGSVVWIRFYFNTYGYYNNDYQGWYVDDVQVLEDIPPEAAFLAAPSEGPRPLEVQFTDATEQNVTSRLWDFGDGGTSTEISPTHTYTASGEFQVTLAVTNASGTDSQSDTIVVFEPPPAADFSAAPASGTWPLTVTFSNLTANEVTGYAWAFGDGATSSEVSPTHVYAGVGSYTVVLTATGPYGTDTETKSGYIAVSDPPPGADFVSSPTGGVVQHTVAFTPALGGGPATGYQWAFGDGDGSTAPTPSHTYDAAGTYPVTLTVSGPGGSNAETKASYVHVAPTPVTDLQVGSWAGGVYVGTARDRGNLYHVVTQTTLSDARCYLDIAPPTTLSFFVYEGVTPEGGFTKIHQRDMAYSGVGEGWYGSSEMDVLLEGGRYYYIGCAWSGTATYGRSAESVPLDTSFGQLVSGVSDGPAGVPPVETVGSLGELGQSPYRMALGFEVEPPPQAGFAAAPTLGEDPLIVEFANTSTGAVSSVLWDFGDGTSSTVVSPSHTYTTTGFYTVTLTVTGPGGSDVETKAEYVEVFDLGPAVIETFDDEPHIGTCGSLGDMGGVFYITRTTKLAKIGIYLEGYSQPAPEKEMIFFVYESDSVPSTFDQLLTEYVPQAGTGNRWYRSGWMDVTLKAGKYYYIGAWWYTGGPLICQVRSEVYGPLGTTFGTYLAGNSGRVTSYSEPYQSLRDPSDSIGGGPSRIRFLQLYTGDWSNRSEVYLPLVLRNH